MIRDPAMLSAFNSSWEFVRYSRNVAVGNCNAASWAVGFNQKGIRDLCFNLLLASAYSVLEEVLREYRDQGTFLCKASSLGALLAASQSSLPWKNWPYIDEGRVKRNQSVHDRIYLPHLQCRNYIAAIELELLETHVLPAVSPELWHW